MNITVYLGANPGTDPAIEDAAREFGAWIGKSGNSLVYGGSKGGLMGLLATSALDAGAYVTGVEPEFFLEEGLQLDEVSELIATKTMAERKAKMIELGDAFVVFPGGSGTLEEASDVMSRISLKHLDAPCIFFNHNGYYNELKALLAKMIDMGFSTPQRQEGIVFASNIEQVEACIEQMQA